MFFKKIGNLVEKKVLRNEIDEKIIKERELSVIYNRKINRCSFYQANPYLDSQDIGRDCKFYVERLNECEKNIDELEKLKSSIYNI